MEGKGRISCCRDCVPPQRHMGCHGTCERYRREKTEYEAEVERIKREQAAARDINEYTRGIADRMRKSKKCWNYKKVRGQK